jgi:serine/threonine-protein kinase
LVIGRVIQETQPAEAFKPGTVIDQHPSPDMAVPPGSAVDFVVARAPGVSSTIPGSASATPPTTSGRPVRIKRADVSVVVPPGPPEQVVSITVLDSRGSREVYRQTHVPGDRVLRTVEGIGDRVRVRVFIDGVLNRDQLIE